MGLFVFYISEKLYHKYFRDYYLQCNTPKYLSLFNSKHPLIPPMPLPYRKPGDESEFRKAKNFLIDIVEFGTFNKYKIDYLYDSHPMRENSSLIDEMLLMDHETSKLLEESMFEADQLALKAGIYKETRNLKKEIDEKNLKIEEKKLRGKVFPA